MGKSGKIRIGVMGCANIAFRSFIPAIIDSEDYELIAIASRTINKAKAFTDIFGGVPLEGYQPLLDKDDLDAVYIPLPTGLHEEWVTKALLANKHVIVEKSMASSLHSAQKMLDIARQNKLVLMEDFMYRYHKQHQLVFELLKNNEIGDLRLLSANFAFPPLPKNNFRYDAKLGGGAILDAAAYTVDVSRWFLGNDLEVACSNLFVERESGTCIYGSATLFSKSTGNTAQLGFGFDNFYQCKYELWGSKGKITVERAFTPPPTLQPKIVVETQNQSRTYMIDADNHFINILKEFASCILLKDYSKHLPALESQARIISVIDSTAHKYQYESNYHRS